MGLWGGESHTEKKEWEIIDSLLEDNKLLIKLVDRLIPKPPNPHHKYRLILITIINNSKYQIMDATLAANQQQAFSFALQDTTDPTKTPTGTFTNGSVATDNAAVATGNVDSTGQVNFVAVAPGTANLTASALTAYTDSLGNPQSAQLTTDPIPVTVTAVVTADGVKLVLTPGAITTQPGK